MPSNLLKTSVLLAVLTAIFVGMGALVGGQQGMVIAFVVALGMNAFSFWNSDSVVLRMFKAQEVSPSQAPELYELVAALAQRAELPMPRVYVMQNPQPNAFATGRSPSRAAVCVSTGLIELVGMEELAGVIAHELAHVKNRDTLTMTVAATIAGAISMFANLLQFGFLFGSRREKGPLGWVGVLVAVILAPFAAMLVQMAISRSREYDADRIGAELTGNPLWLASGLAKIQAAVHRIRNRDAEMVPAGAHLFIVNPLTGRGFDNFFLTHPSTENRIAELQRLAQEWARNGGPPPLELPGLRQSRPRDDGGSYRGPWG